MKRIIRFFVVCLALSVFQTGVVFSAETQKTQSKRDTATTVSTAKNSSRSNATSKQSAKESQQDKEHARTTTITRSSQNAVKNRTAATTAIKNHVVKQRPTTQKKISTVSRNAASSRVANTSKSAKKTTSARTSTNKTAVSRATRTQAILNNDKIANIKSKNYSQCKTVFYDCMDEFCANKDTNLRRCSCSSRIHEFDSIKKQLSNVEDKMLDFNQRLLTVSMKKEDAAAINKASEGELGFNTKDRSESEKLLSKITDSLNNSSDSKFNNEMSAISLDLDVDSAWDSIDSTSGIATTSKNGIELYNAATPVCIEMAKEVCSEDELNIVQGNYKLAIQQDCNTVSKSYTTQYNQAISKIHESGALLDMARLNTYQQQNSDDILTCKKKILEQLNDESVCGKDLYKCLDTTGQYINPATGEAFLSTNLYNLTTLLTTPTGNETWSGMKQNEKFVKFLNSKKVYLETATEQCKSMATVVWKDFLNDALGKIKLAQNAKLEEIRQSCTTLVAECKTNQTKNLSDFDARALSTFGVIADTTVNALCADVQTSCSDLMAQTGGGEDYWETGMDGIAQDTTIDKILETCTTVGKDCIIQQCNGTSGNFALCEKYTDQPRRAILTKQACWNEIKTCVQQGVFSKFDLQHKWETLPVISANNTANSNTDNTDTNPTPKKYCQENDIACEITEYIWGQCEYDAQTALVYTLKENKPDYKLSNRIFTPTSGETLLSWLAYNTGTTNQRNSCSAYTCPMNTVLKNGKCVEIYTPAQDDKIYGPDGEQVPDTIDELIYITISENLRNYCKGGNANKDSDNNCCTDGGYIYAAPYSSNNKFKKICIPENHYAIYLTTLSCANRSSSEGANISLDPYYCNGVSGMASELFCVIENSDQNANIQTLEVQSGTLYCPGFFLLINSYGDYYMPRYTNGSEQELLPPSVNMFYYSDTMGNICTYKFNDTTNKWGYDGTCSTYNVNNTSAELNVSYSF